MIDLTQPPNVINREILKLPFSEQQHWIDKWMAQMPSEINTSIQQYKPVPPDQHWQDVLESTTDALDRPRTGKFGRQARQEYAKNKSESEMKEFLQDPVKVKQTSKAFRNHVKTGLEKMGIKTSEVK